MKGGGIEGCTCEVLRPCYPPPKKKKLERAPKGSFSPEKKNKTENDFSEK